MTDDFRRLLAAVRACTAEEKQRVFEDIRDSIAVHRLETEFGVRAETILEAIARAPDITRRGVRGIIAETVFALEVVPPLESVGWRDDTPAGEHPYDARLAGDGGRTARVQVKLQRKERGRPLVRRGPDGRDHHVVEVQRTRTGSDREGGKTRPYRFGEFDLLAVCMQPALGDGTPSATPWPVSFSPIPATRRSSRRFS